RQKTLLNVSFRSTERQTPKYEEVYLKAYSSVTDAKKQLSAYFEFYNLKRPHSSLDKMTPNEFYYDQLPQQNKVA
ncbi:integrase core domain-containing protein, partial [Klebsiella pneumoniae]